MTIYATRRLLARLKTESPRVPHGANTALGHWYADRFVVDRRPLVLLVSSFSFLPLLLPARDLRSLPVNLPLLVAARLRRLGIAADLIAAELEAMPPIQVCRAVNSTALGILVDFRRSVADHLPVGGWDDTTLPFVEARLTDTPCLASTRNPVWPRQKAPELLALRWHAA